MRKPATTTLSGDPGRATMPRVTQGRPWLYLWGVGCLIAGIVSLVLNRMFVWKSGVFLLVIGVATLFVREAALYVLCGAGVLWIGVPNLLGGNIPFLALGIVEMFLGVVGLVQGARRLAAEREVAQTGVQLGKVSSMAFAPLGALLGVGALLANYRFKLLAAIGLGASTLVLLAWVALMVLARLR
jgi:hypothetical protein